MKPNTVFRVLAVSVSCLSFASFIIWGKQGIISYLDIKKEINQQELAITKLQEQKKLLHERVAQWKEDSFLYEKAAREELLMGKPRETVYLIK